MHFSRTLSNVKFLLEINDELILNFWTVNC